MKSTLILTSTVYVNSALTVLVSAEVRLQQYLQAILFYLNSSEIDKIIICDNSNFDYRIFAPLFSSLSQKEIEYLNFTVDTQLVKNLGKGYGEGEIMKYVVQNSIILNSSEDRIVKITGRLIVTNIDDVLRSCQDSVTYFQPYCSNPFRPNLHAVDTRFFVVDKNIYVNHFLNVHCKVNDINGIFLEHCFYDTINSNLIPTKFMKVMPIFIGFSGSTGLNYSEAKFKSLIRKFLFFLYRFIHGE